MALNRTSRYPGYFTPADALQPQGGFKNRSAPDAKDGTYLEKDWANDWSGFFSALLVNAGVAANNLVDNATASQYFDAMMKMINQRILAISGDMVGMVSYFPMSSPPAGYLKANAAAVLRSDFPALFARIGTTFGAGDGFSTFNLPEARGIFIRGWDDGTGVNPGRAFGSREQSQNLAHTHTASTDLQGLHNHNLNIAAAGQHAHTGGTYQAGEHFHTVNNSSRAGGVYGSWNFSDTGGVVDQPGNVTNPAGSHAHSLAIDANGQHAHTGDTSYGGQHSHTIYVNASGGNESRPINLALLACIKY